MSFVCIAATTVLDCGTSAAVLRVKVATVATVHAVLPPSGTEQVRAEWRRFTTTTTIRCQLVVSLTGGISARRYDCIARPLVRRKRTVAVNAEIH